MRNHNTMTIILNPKVHNVDNFKARVNKGGKHPKVKNSVNPLLNYSLCRYTVLRQWSYIISRCLEWQRPEKSLTHTSINSILCYIQCYPTTCSLLHIVLAFLNHTGVSLEDIIRVEDIRLLGRTEHVIGRSCTYTNSLFTPKDSIWELCHITLITLA